VVERFGELVRDGAAACSGQVVKQIGDEFMLVFPTGTAAVRCGLAIRDLAAAEPRFPALRLGAHAGSVLYRRLRGHHREHRGAGHRRGGPAPVPGHRGRAGNSAASTPVWMCCPPGPGR
jgi:class 3 adenylate cyclase